LRRFFGVIFCVIFCVMAGRLGSVLRRPVRGCEIDAG